MPAPSLLLLDSASLYYRAFFALPESMTAPGGRPNNAVRGFLTTVTRLVTTHHPEQVVACWDSDWRPQWRVDLIPTYKAHRVDDTAEDPGTEVEPESLSAQAEAIAALLSSVGIQVAGVAGYEADDVIASFCSQAGVPVVAVSGDRDLVQVVDDQVRLLLAVNGGMEKWPLLDPAGVEERFGVPPTRYVDLAVLRGDPSDGLPGVRGIGAKTAGALVAAFGDLEAILAAAVDDPPIRPMTARLAQALVDQQDEVRRARVVATAVRDIELPRSSATADEARFTDLAAQWGVERQARDLWRAVVG